MTENINKEKEVIIIKGINSIKIENTEEKDIQNENMQNIQNTNDSTTSSNMQLANTTDNINNININQNISTGNSYNNSSEAKHKKKEQVKLMKFSLCLKILLEKIEEKVLK